MATRRVTCIRKDGSNAQRLIAGIGGEGFYHSVDEAISHIENHSHHYFVETQGESVWLDIGYHADGTAYLKADVETFPPERLLALEELLPEDVPTPALVDEAMPAILASVDNDQQSPAHVAERLALRMMVQMLVSKRFSDDERRRKRTREQTDKRAADVVERMQLDTEAKSQLQDALQAEFDYYLGSASVA